MPDIRTCLWFEDDAEAAVDFYTSLLPDSRIESASRPSPDAPAVLIHFTLAGAPYTALQAGEGPEHTSAASIAATLDTQEMSDVLYDALLARGGQELMCGWITDAWGISWQVMPAGIEDALFAGDPDANAQAFAAMRQMKRLDLAAIQAALPS